MEGQSQKSVKNNDSIYRAASMEAGTTYPTLFEMIGYRKRLAQEMIRAKDDEQFQILEEAYSNLNQEISKLLNLDYEI